MVNERRRLRALSLSLSCMLLGSGWTPAIAQDHPAQSLVPLYRPADVVAGLHRHWAPPRADAFVDESARLQRALRTLCASGAHDAARDLDAARDQWKQAMGAWEQLAAVPFGPLIARRTARQIDFTPTRPQLIERAIARGASGPAQMERIGTPAKGLPALEWLLWMRPLEPATPACFYAVEVAGDILREAQALKQDFDAGATKNWSEDEDAPAFTEFVNQWVGALERLRWQQIERPVREGASGGRSAPSFPRRASGATAASWAQQWSALRALAVSDGNAVPRPGSSVVPLETYLRGRGHTALAGRWVQSITRSDAAMHDLRPGSNNSLLAAARVLAATRRMAEEELAPALEVSIGFSDSDGD